MISTAASKLPESERIRQIPSAERNPANIHLTDYSDAQIREALSPPLESISPLEELIATAEAAFEFIRESEINLATKNAFNQLEKQFSFYKQLLLS